LGYQDPFRKPNVGKNVLEERSLKVVYYKNVYL